MKARNILDAIYCGVNWLCGMYLRPYSKAWNDYLNYLIDECIVVDESDCVITFNDNGEKVEVWKANKYYSYGYQSKIWNSNVYEFRPSFITMIKLSNLVDCREQKRVDAFVSKLAKKVKR
ncbi:hypothetical protein GKR56_17125 [Providencia alcalifaciens]|uniref:hypothetical protein n=1 Tax=Providencia alcalifaciens TaxID=126385 RepID=UPI0012B5344C|nr:hypothetical protein [Providencia alcalifaciens]MTC54945.1 hypothetical protein [Providencia alcalifaciens]